MIGLLIVLVDAQAQSDFVRPVTFGKGKGLAHEAARALAQACGRTTSLDADRLFNEPRETWDDVTTALIDLPPLGWLQRNVPAVLAGGCRGSRR